MEVWPGDTVETRCGPVGTRWGPVGARWGPRVDHQVWTKCRPAGAGTRWGHGGDQVGPGGDPVGTRWGQVGTTWGPPGGDQVETSRGGDQVGTRWGHGGDQVGPGGDPVGTRTNGPAMKHGHSWQDKAAVPLKYKAFDNYNNDGKPIKRHAARYLRIFEGIGWAAYTTCLSMGLPSCLGCGISIFPSAGLSRRVRCVISPTTTDPMAQTSGCTKRSNPHPARSCCVHAPARRRKPTTGM